MSRLARTLDITPAGGPEDRILEMGAYLQITPSLKSKLGYGYVRGCYYGPAGKADHRPVSPADGDVFWWGRGLFEAEKDPVPYTDQCFSPVTCCVLSQCPPHGPTVMAGEI